MTIDWRHEVEQDMHSMATVYAVADLAAGTTDLATLEHTAARRAAILLLDLAMLHPEWLIGVVQGHRAWRDRADAGSLARVNAQCALVITSARDAHEATR